MARGVERFPVGPPRGSRRRRGRGVSSSTASTSSTPSAATSTTTSTPRRPRAAAHSTSTVLTSKQRLASRLYNLEMDVAELTREIQQLNLHRSLLYTRALFSPSDLDGSAVRQARGYFEVFRHGLRGTDPRPPAYLASIADENLQLGVTDVLGRDMLVEQWRRYTAYFAIREYDIRTVRVIAAEDGSKACIVRGEGVFRGTFTRQALEIAFPSVLRDHQLTQQLLGRALVTPVAFVLHFDANGRFVRHDGEVDLFAALSQTLQDPIRAAAIMERAIVAEEGMLDAPDEDARQPIEPTDHVARTKRSRFEREHEKEDEEKRGPLMRGEPDLEPDDDDVDGSYSVSV